MNQKKIIYDIGFKVDESGTQKATGALAKITTALKQIKGTTIDSFVDSSGITDLNKANEQLKLIQASAVAVGNALQSSFNQNLNTFNIANFNKELKATGFSIKDLNTLWGQLGSQGNIAFMQVADAITQTQSVARKTTGVFNELGKTMANTIRWKVTSELLQNFTGSLQAAWGYTKALDSSLNDIRIVTGQSALQMEKFAKSANSAALKLAASTTTYTNASLIYYQQGLSDKEVEARTKVTIKAANVTGQSAAEVSEQLTAVWNGYKVVAEEAELYVDKLAAVAASTAADLEELSTGMSKVASAANAMGVNIDQLSAQMATIVSVTRQDASLVGTALKTIYARMGDLQVDGVDEFGTSLGDVSGKMRQMGIDILDQEGNLRDMGNIIEEVAQKWETWTDAQQQAAAVAIAGKRQYNNLIALFENWDMYESSLATSQNAEGTLEEQQKTYKESIQAMIQEVETAREGFKGELFDAESIEKVTNALEGLFKALEFLTSSLGGLKNILPLVIGLLMKMSPAFSGTLVKGIYDFGVGIKNMFTGANNMKLLGDNVDEASKEMKELNAQFATAINNRLKLEKMHKAGLIDDDTYSAIKETNEGIIRKTEEQAQLQQDRETKDARDRTIGSRVTLTDIAGGVGNSKNFAEGLGKDIKDLSQHGLKESNESYNKYIINIDKNVEKLKDNIKKTKKEFNTAKKNITSATKNTVEKIKEIEGLDYLTDKQKNQLETLKKKLEEATTKTDKRKALAETNNVLTEMGESYLDMADNMKEEATAVAKGQDQLAKNSNIVKENQDKVNKSMSEFKGLEIGQNIADMTSSFLMAISAAGTLTNVMEGLKNGTMGVGEAITGIVSSVATAAPAFSGAFKMIKTAGVGAGGAIQKAFGWISLVMNIIAIAVSLISSIVKMVGDTKSAEDKARERYEAMNKTLEDMNKNYQETRKSLIELKDEIADYRDARKGIDELRAGTEEWKDAIEALNLKVLELIDKYPQLRLIRKEVYGQTLYELDSASIDEAIKAKKDSIASQEWSLAVQKYRTAGAKKDLQIEEMRSSGKIPYKNLNWFTVLNNSGYTLAKWANAISQQQLNNFLGEKIGIDNIAANYEIDTLQLAANTTLDELMLLEKEIASSNDLNEEQKLFLQGAVEEAKKANQNLESINKTLSQEEENVLRAFAKTQGVDENVFTNIAKNNENAVPEVDTKNKDRRDFIKNKGFNKFVHIELNDDGSIKMNGGTIQTTVKQRVGGEVQKGDVSQAKEWIDNLVAAAYGPNARVESYGKLQGVATANLGAVEIVVDGEKKTIDQVRNDVFTAAQRQAMGEENAALLEYQKQLQNEGKLEEAAYFALGIGYEGIFDAKNFQWDEGTLAKYNTIASYDGDVGKNAGKAKGEFEKEISDYLEKVGLSSEDLTRYSQMTGSEIKSLTNAVFNASSYTGGKEALTAIINEIQDPVQMKKLQSLLATANWESSEWISNFQLELHEMGLNLEDDSWKKFFDTINSGMKQWIDSSERVRTNLSFIKGTLEGLELGGTLSDEEYNQLLTIAPEAAKYFMKSADGYVALTSGEKISQIARSKYTNLSDVKDKFAEIRNQAANVNNVGIHAGDGANAITAKELLKYMGFEIDFDSETGAAKGGLTIDWERVNAIAGLLGINSEEISKYVRRTVWDPEKRETMISQLRTWVDKADQIMTGVASGYYEEQSATDIYLTSGVSYQEAKNQGLFDYVLDDNGEVTNREEVDRNRSFFTNQLRTELGVSADWYKNASWEEIVEIADKTYYLSLDHYQQVEAALDRIDTELENSTGATKWGLWRDKITSSQDAILIAQNKAEYSQAVYDASADAIKNNESYAFANSLFNKDGSLNLAAAYSALTEYRGTEAEKDIQKLIDDYIANEEAKTEVIGKQNEAIEVQLDLLKEQQDAVETFVKFLNDEKEFWDVQMGDRTVQGFLGEASVDAQMGLISQKTDGLMANFENSLYNLAKLKSEEGGLNSAAFVEAYEQAKEYLLNYKDLIKETEELWLSTVDKTLELYDKQIERFKTLNSVLQNTADLTKLIGTDTNSLINTYYMNFVANAQRTYSGALEKMQQAQKIYNNVINTNVEVSDERRAKAIETLETTTQDFLTAATEWAEAIKTAFTERVSTAITNALKDATGYGLSDMSQAWELEVAKDERYLDEVNSAYAIGEFERKIQKSIDETDNLAVQKKLNDLRARELELLEQKGKLTQYDLDRANAEYELELKRIALEESQQASNKMKLTRDAMGNYTYQYVADQDAIAQAEEELAAAQNELYNLDKDRKKELIDEWFSMMTEYESKMSEAMETGNTALQDSIQDYYFGSNGILKAIQDELNLMGTNADWLNNVFNDTSNRILDVKIIGEDGKDLATTLNDIFGDTKNSFATLTGTISSENGLNTSIESLKGNADNAAKALNNLSKTGAADKLVSNLGELASNISSYTRKLIEALGDLDDYRGSATKKASEDALATNTEAIKVLTASAYTLVDKLDGKFDGNYAVEGFLDANKKAQYYTIIENE